VCVCVKQSGHYTPRDCPFGKAKCCRSSQQCSFHTAKKKKRKMEKHSKKNGLPKKRDKFKKKLKILKPNSAVHINSALSFFVTKNIEIRKKKTQNPWVHPDAAVHHRKKIFLSVLLHTFHNNKKELTHVTDVKFFYIHIYAPCRSRQ
jgi:hypothetical protein